MMARRRTGDKPLSEPIMIYVTDAYMRHSMGTSGAETGIFQAN